VVDLASILMGFQTAFQPVNLIYCFIGVFLGTFVGVLPGIGPLATISMLLPITFYLDPTTALVMLAGVYYGSDYGGSIASILLRLPGGASSAVTCLDGYPMAQQGRAGVALFITSVGSFIGGSFGIILMMCFAPTLANFTVAFASVEYFALMVLGLAASGSITSGSPLKGLAMVALGLAVGCIGTDVNSGTQRFTFGFLELFDSVETAVVAMAMFGISEVVSSIATPQTLDLLKEKVPFRSMLPTRDDVIRSGGPILRGTAIGSVIGIMPGVGGTVASLMSYATEKRVSRTPERFGKGAVEGVAGPESANNASAQTSFIPTLTMGIPGGASMALMLSALMIHGITPGPGLMRDHPDVFWGLVASFWVGNVMLLVLNIPMIGIWIKILKIPYQHLFPAIMVLLCIGVYSLNNSIFDLYLLLALGLTGYIIRLLDFEPAPFLIGFVLGPTMEENFRRAMLVAQGDLGYFLTRPYALTMLLAAAALLLWSIVSNFRQRPLTVESILPEPHA
jgi:putative tricarboxylic transport membrane protein